MGGSLCSKHTKDISSQRDGDELAIQKKPKGIPVKTLILIDATGTMANLLKKQVKNSLATMFDRI